MLTAVLNDPVVMEFDHLRDKTVGVIRVIFSKASIERLQAEIDKREVRCANCNRRKTARSFGSYRLRQDLK